MTIHYIKARIDFERLQMQMAMHFLIGISILFWLHVNFTENIPETKQYILISAYLAVTVIIFVFVFLKFRAARKWIDKIPEAQDPAEQIAS